MIQMRKSKIENRQNDVLAELGRRGERNGYFQLWEARPERGRAIPSFSHALVLCTPL